MRLVIAGFLVCLLLPSCVDEDECGVTDFAEEVYLSYKNYETKETRSVDFESITLAYTNGENVSIQDTLGRAVPVDLEANATTIQFDTGTEILQLAVQYKVTALIENPDCGPVFRVTGLAIDEENTTFDSVVVRVTELSKLFTPHVEVYF